MPAREVHPASVRGSVPVEGRGLLELRPLAPDASGSAHPHMSINHRIDTPSGLFRVFHALKCRSSGDRSEVAFLLDAQRIARSLSRLTDKEDMVVWLAPCDIRGYSS
jgi:hypothetical protein